MILQNVSESKVFLLNVHLFLNNFVIGLKQAIHFLDLLIIRFINFQPISLKLFVTQYIAALYTRTLKNRYNFK